ncbi:MAG: TonB-dependent receptor [Gammaproteobacteria bacterium]|nr:TonB-dependent receptor [Gammaproteobacteria bacterium]MBU2157479.1 TonB-dependent receptor [Gammaproteobacteria bacterium]MBU2255214.1 TonB-dependent receptor [Gammaproteobacteria bacterium]MBU2294614.1 TonB-dependent receptor [Gammaproteobacteria bacterium]
MKLSRLALAVALLPPAIQAETRDHAQYALTLPALVISSGRQAEPRKQAVAATTVFTREAIERLQARDVMELLRRVPGIQTGNSSGVPSYFVRGSSTAQTLVLVDGQRIASASSGIARLDYLSVDNIERIEVVRGPRSSLYGADAIGGVIQIFTRRGKAGLAPEVRIAAGSDHTIERRVGLSGGDQKTTFHLGASLDESAGFDRTRDDQGADRDHDGARTRALALNLQHELNDDWQAGFSLNDQRGDSEYDDAYEFAPSEPHDQFRVSSFSSYLEGQVNQDWNSRVELGRSYDRNKALSATSAWNTGRLETTRHSAAWINRLELNEHHNLTLGGEWYEDRVDSTTTLAEDRRSNRAVFIQHTYKTQQLSTELGLRHDENQLYGSSNSWNGALIIPTERSQTWVLSYGEGFRAPTFSDLYYPGAGNPNLQAETSKAYELQWRAELGDNQLEVAIYRNDITNLIAWNSTTNQPENIKQARINGFELSVSRDLLGWQSALSLNFLDPRDRDNGHTLARRARRTVNLDIDRQFAQVQLGASWRAVSRRYDDAANTSELSGYGLLDLRASWQSNAAWRWDVKLNNLLDRDYWQGNYQRPTGPNWNDPSREYAYQEEGRSLLFALTWTPDL